MGDPAFYVYVRRISKSDKLEEKRMAKKQTEKKGAENKGSYVPVILCAVIIILALGGSVFLGIRGMGFGGKVKSKVSQEEIDKARAKERADAQEDQDVYVTAFKEDVTLTPGSAPATSENKGAGTAVSGEYLLPDSNTKYLTEADVSGLSKADLRIARNEILARHGRIFESEDLKTYFESKSWYSGTVAPKEFDADMESRLSKVELANIEMIKKYE